MSAEANKRVVKKYDIPVYQDFRVDDYFALYIPKNP